MKIKAVCFDLDGLMFNTEDIFNQSGRELLARRKYELADALLEKMMGRRSHESFAIMIEELKLTETIEQLQLESDLIFNGILEEKLTPMPGLFQLLELIEHKQLPKGVATSSRRSYLQDILGRHQLAPRFHILLGAEDVEHGKPHPEIYLTAAKKLGVEPHEMLVLEDSGIGTRAAGAAGAHIVSVPHHHSRNQDFSSAKHIATSLVDPYILNLLDG